MYYIKNNKIKLRKDSTVVTCCITTGKSGGWATGWGVGKDMGL